MSEEKIVHIFLSGRVQGVGFRAFIRENAHRLGVKGWAKNLNNGRVEAVFSGPEEKVDKLVELVKKGPRFGKVKNIKINNDIDEEFTNFEIRY